MSTETIDRRKVADIAKAHAGRPGALVPILQETQAIHGYLPRETLEIISETTRLPLAEICTRVVHFTGYEMDPADIEVANSRERRLGELLGTADLIAQMADVDYARKCR